MLTEFGKLLRTIRINSGDNADEMAKKLYISPSYLYLIENGKRKIPVDMEKNIINAYQISKSDRDTLHRAIISEQINKYESLSGISDETNDDTPIKEYKFPTENETLSAVEDIPQSDTKKHGGKAVIIIALAVIAVAIIAMVIIAIINRNTVLPPETEQTTQTGASITKPSEIFEYEVTDDHIRITKYIGLDANVTVPAEIDGKSVYEIGEGAFADDRILKRVVLSDGIQRIGFHVFDGCPNLEYIEIPDSVFYIGEGLAVNCTSLKEVVIGDGTALTGGWAFWGCTSLESVKLGKKICQIDHNAFNSCASLAEIELPSGVIKISYLAFYGCSALKNVVIPDGIMSIEERAFASCSNLESIYVPSSLTWFSNDIFKDCPKLTVYGETGSDIERYCADNGYNFKTVSDAGEMK